MKEANLKLAQEDINAALEAVEDIEKVINDESVEKDVLKEAEAKPIAKPRKKKVEVKEEATEVSNEL